MPPFDGNGIYELPVTTVTPAVDGTTIDSAEFNTFTGDIKTALTLCIAKDGQTASPTITTPTITTPAITGNTSVAGNVTFDASAAIRQVIFDTGTNLSYFQGDTAGDIFLNDGTNARTVWSYDESANEFNVISELNTTNAQLTTPTLTSATGSLESPVINTGVSGTAGVSRMIQETAQATTSGTTVDFTGIPSWAKEVNIILDQVSSDAVTTDFICQIGDSGGLEITNYSYTISTSKIASIVTTSNTADSSIHVTSLIPAASHCNGEVKIINVNGNVWEFSGLLSDPVGNELYSIAGRKSLSGALDRFRFSLTSGSFDAGQINIIYKG